MGFGIINWVFALPAFWTIDILGRRRLLLSTFPFMAVFQAFLAIAFGVRSGEESPTWRIALVIAGMYLFGVAYSPGEGPVPFVSVAVQLDRPRTLLTSHRCIPQKVCLCTIEISVSAERSDDLNDLLIWLIQAWVS